MVNEYKLSYTAATIDNKLGEIDEKMEKENPTGTGALSLNRAAGSTVGNYSVAEGFNTIASGIASHAEGSDTVASGENSHAEGKGPHYGLISCFVTGAGTAGAIGFQYTITFDNPDFVIDDAFRHSLLGAIIQIEEGTGVIQSVGMTGDFTIEVNRRLSSNELNTVQGIIYRGGALGMCSHAEGYKTTASENYSHAEGIRTVAEGNYSHAEGNNTITLGNASHAEGYQTVASGDNSHAEGYNTIASGAGSHAEGGNQKFMGSISTDGIVLGWTVDSTELSFTGEDSETITYTSTMAYGTNSHAEGLKTLAKGNYSHSEGAYTKASSDYQHVQGKYNVEDTNGTYAFIIGNGTDDDARSNALAIDWNGNIFIENSALQTAYTALNAI